MQLLCLATADHFLDHEEQALVKSVQTSIQQDCAECTLIAECPLTTFADAQQSVAVYKSQSELRTSVRSDPLRGFWCGSQN